MAVRLAVIVIQTAPAGDTGKYLVESVIGELLGRPGIDVTLIRRLDNLDAESTDRITLESHAGDAAVLDWQAPEATVATLAKVGFDGVRAPHDHDPHPVSASAPGRRIYAFDLRKFEGATEVREAVEQLLARRRVRTFSLDGLGGPSRSPDSDGTPQQDSHQDVLPKPGTASPVAPRSPISTSARAQFRQQADGSSDDGTRETDSDGDSKDSDASSTDLDALLDQLDELDP